MYTMGHYLTRTDIWIICHQEIHVYKLIVILLGQKLFIDYLLTITYKQVFSKTCLRLGNMSVSLSILNVIFNYDHLDKD